MNEAKDKIQDEEQKQQIKKYFRPDPEDETDDYNISEEDNLTNAERKELIYLIYEKDD